MKGTPYRYISFFLTLLGMLSACTSEGPQKQSGMTEVTFRGEMGTRASLVTNSTITAAPFVVYSDMYSMDPSDESKYITVHNATVVSYNGISGAWEYEDTQFWFPGYQYSFLALSPAANSTVTVISFSKGELRFTYTQPAVYSSASDLLLSAHRRDYPGGAATVVNFRFSHILSHMGVSVKLKDPGGDGSYLRVNSLKFINVPVEADYSVTPAALAANKSQNDDCVFDAVNSNGWTSANYGDIAIDLRADGQPERIIPNDQVDYQLFSNSDALLLLPNADGGSQLQVAYTMYTDGGAESEDRVATVDIPKGWLRGSNCQLSLFLNNGSLKCTVEVAPWQPFPDINTTVPRK